MTFGIAHLIHPKLFVSSMVLLLGGAACACWEWNVDDAAVQTTRILVIDGRRHVRHRDPPRYVYRTQVDQDDPIYWPYPVAAGAVLFGLGVLKRRKYSIYEGETTMTIPQRWDEATITRDIQKYGPDKGLVTHYIQQLVSRFVDGVDGKTAISRKAFIEKQNELLKVGLENVRLRRQVLRANQEEDNADEKVRREGETLASESSLHQLKTDLERETILTEIERKRHERSNIGKEPTPPPVQKKESAGEIRERERTRIKSRMREIREEIRLTEANPNLGEEEKQRFINMLEDRLAALEAEYAKLL